MNIIAAVLPLSVLLFVGSAAYAKIDKYPCQVDGQVKNLTTNIAGSISLTLTKVDATHYRAKGNFDNKKLFGNFDVGGTLGSSTSKDDRYNFAGEIDMGVDGSNIKAGTKAKYDMAVTLDSNGPGTGTYHISSYVGSPKDQNGTLNLTWNNY